MLLYGGVAQQSPWSLVPGRLPSQVRKNRQGRQERQGNEVKNSYFHRLLLFFLGVLGGSKIDFAIVLLTGP